MKLVLLALFWRPLLRTPVRLLITVLGVAAGVASVLATIAASHAAVHSLARSTKEIAGRTVLEITRPGRVPEGVLGELRSLSALATLLPVVEESVQIPIAQKVVRLLGVDLMVDFQAREFLADENAGASITEEALLSLQGGAFLPSPLAEELGVRQGDRFQVLAHAQLRELCVAAVFDPPRLAGAFEALIVVDIATSQELVGRPGFLDRIELVPRIGVSAEKLRETIDGILPASCVVTEPETRARQTTSMLRSLEFNLAALSGVSLLVSAVLVATTLATSIVQRRPQLSLLVSLGASSRTIAVAVLIESLAIGFAGGLLGIALGHLGARLSVESVRATVSTIVRGIPSAEVRFDPVLVVGGLALGILVSLLAGLVPLKEALSLPPIQGLRPQPSPFLTRREALASVGLMLLFLGVAWLLALLPAWNGLPFAAHLSAFAILAALAFSSSPIIDLVGRMFSRLWFLRSRLLPRLSVSTLTVGRGRVTWGCTAMGMACALAVAMATMIHSFRESVVDWTSRSMQADLFLKSMNRAPTGELGTMSPEVLRIAEDRFGRGSVDPYYSSEAFIGNARIAFAGSAFEVAARHGGGVPFRRGRASAEVFAAARSNHSVIINESLARRFRLGEGGTLKLRVAGGVQEWRVEGVFVDYSSSEGLAVIDREDYLKRYPDHGPYTIDVYLGEGEDAATAREQLQWAIGTRHAVTILHSAGLRRQILDVFERTFAITRALQMIAAIVAVIAVLTVLNALIDEQSRNLAVLVALGASRTQVFGVVIIEALVLSLIAAVAGSAFGGLVGVVLVKVVNVQSFGWTLRLLFPAASLCTLVGFVLLSGLLAGMIPALSATRLQIREVLHQET